VTLTAYFTNQVSYAVDFVKFTNDAVVVIAEEAGECCRKRIKLFSACGTFRGLLAFALQG